MFDLNYAHVSFLILKRIGWFIEGILPLICFGKASFNGQFTGITNDAIDISVDTIRGMLLNINK